MLINSTMVSMFLIAFQAFKKDGKRLTKGFL